MTAVFNGVYHIQYIWVKDNDDGIGDSGGNLGGGDCGVAGGSGCGGGGGDGGCDCGVGDDGEGDGDNAHGGGGEDQCKK